LGVVFGVALAAWLWVDHNHSGSIPGVWLVPLLIVLVVLAAGETITLLTSENLRPSAIVVYAGSLTIALSPWLAILWPHVTLGPLGWPLLAVGLSFLVAVAHAVIYYQRETHAATRLALTTLSLLFIGLLLCFVVQLRLIDKGQLGVLPLVSLVIVVKMSDIGAYTVGRLIGKHKLAPSLSPGKTIEGLAGGVAFACLAAAMVWMTLDAGCVGALENSGASLMAWLLFAPLVTLAGIVGDLAESMLKRDAGQKDSSTWMPGFGGVLDLLDSILFSAPVAYVFWASGLLP